MKIEEAPKLLPITVRRRTKVWQYTRDSKKRKEQVESAVGWKQVTECGMTLQVQGWMLNGCSRREPIAWKNVETGEHVRSCYDNFADAELEK